MKNSKLTQYLNIKNNNEKVDFILENKNELVNSFTNDYEFFSTIAMDFLALENDDVFNLCTELIKDEGDFIIDMVFDAGINTAIKLNKNYFFTDDFINKHEKIFKKSLAVCVLNSNTYVWKKIVKLMDKNDELTLDMHGAISNAVIKYNEEPIFLNYFMNSQNLMVLTSVCSFIAKTNNKNLVDIILNKITDLNKINNKVDENLNNCYIDFLQNSISFNNYDSFLIFYNKKNEYKYLWKKSDEELSKEILVRFLLDSQKNKLDDNFLYFFMEKIKITKEQYEKANKQFNINKNKEIEIFFNRIELNEKIKNLNGVIEPVKKI